MRILHVTLGLPPLRTGGLTRYSVEVMEGQKLKGDEVSVLYPGRFLPGHTRIHQDKWHGITTYEVINPLPVALTYGMADPVCFTAPCDNPNAFTSFLAGLQPDVIHVHSYQGIYAEFFEAAHEAAVPMVFTTHDYYPMCPRCTFVTASGDECEDGPSAEGCAVCNVHAGMTFRKSMVMQSGVYIQLKNSPLVRKLGSRVKGEMSSGTVKVEAATEDEIRSYSKLLDYNRKIFKLFNLILANSSMTLEQYKHYYPGARYALLPITHARLARAEHKPAKKDIQSVLRIGYYGGRKAYKGYETLVDACQLLSDRSVAYELHLWGDDYGVLPEGLPCFDHGRIAPEKVQDSFQEHDVIVVPSLYRETFGFVVLEALCADVPVICSDVVGAKDLISSEYVFPAGNDDSLAYMLMAFASEPSHEVHLRDDYPLSLEVQLERLKSAYVAVGEESKK